MHFKSRDHLQRMQTVSELGSSVLNTVKKKLYKAAFNPNEGFNEAKRKEESLIDKIKNGITDSITNIQSSVGLPVKRLTMEEFVKKYKDDFNVLQNAKSPEEYFNIYCKLIVKVPPKQLPEDVYTYLNQNPEQCKAVPEINLEPYFEELKKLQEEEKKKGTEKAAKTAKTEKAVRVTPLDQFITGFTTTFTTLIIPAILIFGCTFAGSLAANDAIGRSPGIRLVYFIYGSIPIFSPLVFLYYIYRYFINTYPVWYNFLPLTTWQPENSFLQAIVKPFTYTEDANTKYMFQQFNKSALKWITEEITNYANIGSNTKTSSSTNTSSTNTSSTNTSNTNTKRTNNLLNKESTGTNTIGPTGTMEGPTGI